MTTAAHFDAARKALIAAGFPPPADPALLIRRRLLLESVAYAIGQADVRGQGDRDALRALIAAVRADPLGELLGDALRAATDRAEAHLERTAPVPAGEPADDHPTTLESS